MFSQRHGLRLREASRLRPPWTVRVLTPMLATVLILSACGSKDHVVYDDHEVDGHAAYTPFARSTSPLVHVGGGHHLVPDVQIGSGHASPYVPIGTSGGALVDAPGAAHPYKPVTLGYERKLMAARGSEDSHGAPESTPTPIIAAKPSTAVAGARAAASPTPPANMALRSGLGATAGARPPVDAPPLAQEDEEASVLIAGRIESIAGNQATISTPGGMVTVRLSDGVRVERDMRGNDADLKPGQFVGALHLPGGPASVIRLYNTGPSMPRAGVVPVVGSREGQVTTFGQVVNLQFGGLLLNTGGQTQNVTLPSGVEVLKSGPADPSMLKVGTSVIASGALGADGTVAAKAVRVTGSAPPPVVPTARRGP
ncbi:MAG: hypothetical protein AB7P40_01430 [Chloroflexota bacterium]